MIKQINQVKEFHEKFGILVNNNLQSVELNLAALRVKLIEEEAKEVKDAIFYEGVEEVAKELCDLLYVTYGTILTFGLQNKIEECFDEVHRSNMSKLGKDGKPVYREDGKLLKGDNYSPANMQKILNVVE